MIKDNNRILYLDVARGIAMVCIVLGHLGISQINSVVYLFHLPSFYFISGYFLNRTDSVSNVIKKNINKLLKPYYVTCAVICLVAMLLAFLKKENVFDQLIKWGYASLYAAGDSWTTPFYIKGIGALWFLWASFIGITILKLLNEVNKYIRFFTVMLCFSISVLTWKIIWLPLSVQAGLCGLLFMYIGYLYRSYGSKLLKVNRLLYFLILLSLIYIYLWCIINFKAFWLVHCQIAHIPVDVLGSMGG